MSGAVPADARAAARATKAGKITPAKIAPAKITPAKLPRRAPVPDVIGPNGVFRDGKDEGALRTIGEVATALGLRQHVLRYWEEQFPMLRPLTRAGARRYYRPADIALLIQIDRLLHREGYTIRGARQALMCPVGKRATPSPARDATDAVPIVEPVQDLPMLSDAPAEQSLVSALAVLRQHLESIHQRLSGALSKA